MKAKFPKFLTTCCILSFVILSAVITPTTATPVASKPTGPFTCLREEDRCLLDF